MSAAPKLYQPDARCPRCGAPPRLGMTQRQMEKWQDEPPYALVQTYQCSWELGRGRKCNAIYPITAGAVQRATEIEG